MRHRGNAHCAWCARPLGIKRSDAKFCRKSCRQAAWRARIARCSEEAGARPLRLAYADPPYPGHSDIYRGDPAYAGEVNIPQLLSLLASYDGWALSTSAAGLPGILAECVSRRLTVRVAIWVRTPRPHKISRILNAWEALLFHPARQIVPPRYRQDAHELPDATPPLRVHDALVGVNPRRRPTLPGNCPGMKPPAFCEWLFRLLGALPGDHLDDLFPGSGIVTRAWKDYTGDPSPGPTPDAPALGSATGGDPWTS